MRIRYVGKKPFNLDNMYGSNGLWVGHGDIQVVEDEKIAQLMCKGSPWFMRRFRANPRTVSSS